MNLVINDSVLVIGLTALVTILFTLMARRARQTAAQLKPDSRYETLKKQAGRAIESGQRIHVGLGRASLHEAAVPASVAAQSTLNHIATASAQGDMMPVVTVGDATLLPIAEEALRSGRTAARGEAPPLYTAEFIANNNAPLAYGAGSSYAIQRDDIGSNVLLGHFGAEMALMTEAGARAGVEQIVGSDNPVALAIATAYTENVLIGEEFLAADAYLDNKAVYTASLYVQNILRVGIIFLISVTVVLQMLNITLAELIR